MQVFVDFSDPDASFWDQYARLWDRSIGRSPFQSPSLLQFFSAETTGKLSAFRYVKDGQLLGAALFKKGKKEWNFLSDLKTDHNFFVIDNRCSQDEIRDFFTRFLGEVKRKKKALLLNNQPVWSPYMDAFLDALKSSGLFWEHLSYSVCPAIEADSPEDLFARINKSREFRYRVNRLVNQQKAVFEALTDAESIDHWADQFTSAHIRRWDGSPTPSSFLDPYRIHFLKGCLHAWQKDGILVRFSILAGEQRVGFVVGLRQENTLVHHSTTYDPDFKKYSPGIAIIHFMGEWMKDQGMHILDFGDGDENYKYSVANKEHELSRVFISAGSNVPFIIKTKMIKSVRNNAKLFDFYREKIKPLTS